jgi:hypothetical protein
MTTFQAEGTVTRTYLSLSNLVIAPSAGYYIQRDGFGPGEVIHRKNQVSSIYLAGSYQTHAVKDQQTTTLKVRVQGSDQSQLYTRMETLAVAMEQFNFTLKLYINGVAYQYDCDTADYSVGDTGNVQDLWLRSDTQIMTFQIPHKPIVSGFI